jgi:hypothetical protein
MNGPTILTRIQIFSMSFLGITLGIDDQRQGRHQWDMPLLDYLQTTEVGSFIPAPPAVAGFTG